MRTLFTIVLIATAAAAARATTILPATLDQISREAAVIARGEVVALDAEWTSDHRGITTLVTLQADEYMKGSFGRVFRFRIPGGRLGRFQSVTVGAPQFAVGQHVVVFLAAQGPAVPHIVGLNQGVYRVIVENGRPVVTPPAVSGSSTVKTAASRIVRGDPSRKAVALEDFERQVRALAGASKR
jgi:hypothetical protein